MPATHFDTPVGLMPMTESQQAHYGGMTDEQLADELFESHFVDPLVLAELCDRGLAFSGDTEADIRARARGDPVPRENREWDIEQAVRESLAAQGIIHPEDSC